MNSADPIILTAYLLCLAYFIYKILDSFNDEYAVRLDEDALKQQLAEKNLQDAVSVSFGFDKHYEFDKLKQVNISVSNKSSSYSIYVDWDCSAFTDFGGRSRRVTRLMPGTTLDLFQNQVFSTVAPNTTLKEAITAEDILQRKNPANDAEFQIVKPLIDPKVLNDPKNADNKKKFERFMKQKLELEFSLELALRFVGPQSSLTGDRVNILCKFILKKLPLKAGFPWNPR